MGHHLLYINISILINSLEKEKCHYHPTWARAFRMKDTRSVFIYFRTVITVTDLNNLNLNLNTKINHGLPELKYSVLFFKNQIVECLHQLDSVQFTDCALLWTYSQLWPVLIFKISPERRFLGPWMLMGKTLYLTHMVLTTFKNFIAVIKKLIIYCCKRLIHVFSCEHEHTASLHPYKWFYLDICMATNSSKG